MDRFFTLIASAAAVFACNEASVGPDGCAFLAHGLPPLKDKLSWGPDSLVFADNMVLASSDAWHAGSTPARVWGVVDAGETVTVGGLPGGAVVAPSNPFTANATGGFLITIAVPASLTAYNISFTGAKSSVTLHNVLFGHTVLVSLCTTPASLLLAYRRGLSLSPSFIFLPAQPSCSLSRVVFWPE